MARTNSKRISKYLPESEITTKGHLNQQKQQPVTEDAEKATPIATNAIDKIMK